MIDRNRLHEDAKKKEKKLRNDIEKEGGVSGKDVFAMLTSAFIVIFPITIALIVGLSLLMLWLFGAI